MGEARLAEQPIGALTRAVQSWEGLSERLPVGVYICDRRGVVVHYNRRAAELWGGLPPSGGGPVPFNRAYHADGAPMSAGQSPVAEALATGAPVRDREVVIDHGEGRRVHVLANVEPLRDDDGKLIGAVNCLQDITELRRTRDMLRSRRGWARRILETSPIAMYQTDAEGRIQIYNPAAAALWGREPRVGEDRWCGSFQLYAPGGAPMPRDACPMAQAIKEQRPIVGAEVVFERPDGGRGAFLAYPTPLFDASGDLAGAINMLVDISERKRAEDLQKTLMDELNHRVKNTLATVQSLAAHSFHATGDLEAMRQAFEARLMALSCVHNRLADRRWETVGLGEIVEGVAAATGGARLSAAGASVELSTRAAVVLAMALHELATNAAKYGALSAAEGRVAVVWEAVDGALALAWREEGGPSACEPARRGFGLRFVRRAVEQELRGTVGFEFGDAGFACRISAPIPTSA